MDDTIKEFNELIPVLNKAWQLYADVLALACEAIVEPFRQLYKELGYPYGNTDDGFLIWLNSLNAPDD